MHLKLNGEVTVEELVNYYNVLLLNAEEETNEKVFCRGIDLYIRLENEGGKTLDILGQKQTYTVELSDRYQDEVLKRLNQRMKQVEIAKELGISQQRVSKIKKKLSKEGLLDFFYTNENLNVSNQQLEFIKTLGSFIEEESFILVEDMNNCKPINEVRLAEKLNMNIVNIKESLKGLQESKVMVKTEVGGNCLYIVNPKVLGRKGTRMTNLIFGNKYKKTTKQKASRK